MNYNEIVKNVNVYGLEESIRGAKFPMSVDVDSLNTDLTPGIEKLAMSGIGEGHDQFLTGITVQFDLTYTVKAWTEAERYRFLYYISSQSTLHRITRFDLDKSYISYVDPRAIAIMKELVSKYNETANALAIAEKDPDSKQKPGVLEEMRRDLAGMYLTILYTNPCGFRLTARMTTNYRQLKTIYKQRRTHRLPEWRAFCDWIKTLPMSHLITGEKETE